MGVCNATANDPNTKHINQQLSQAQREESTYKKLLFLGPGGSGKSTIFKQLQWTHGGGYTNEFSNLCKKSIHAQIILQMKSAIKHYLINNDDNKQQEISPQIQEAIEKIKKYHNELILTKDIAESISLIWKTDHRLKDIFTTNHIIKVLDETTEYFWNDIERISTSNYMPNRMDIINVRNATIGIIQKKFVIEDVAFHIFDVGGQKSERKKWINLFDEVDGIAFVVALSSYNQVMFEDENTNCMSDALQLFDDVINKNIFIETPIILFLNKMDLFQQKIQDLPITVCPAFNDFDVNKNAKDFTQTIEYIKNKFKAINRQEREIYIHVTYALDNVNIKDVFDEIAQIIVSVNLEKCDLIV